MQKQEKSKLGTTIRFIVVAFFAISLGFLGYVILSNDFSNDNENTNEQQINVYFSNTEIQRQNQDCAEVFPSVRSVPQAENIEEVALEELFKGTTIAEEEQGLHTDISPEFSIKNLSIANGTATVILHEDLELIGHSTCQATTIKNQITKTLEQFSSINNVVITTQ